MTKGSPTKCAEPHVSIIGHATVEEIQRYLSLTETANGFGNRHLWALVKRSKLLPCGASHLPDEGLVRRLQEAAAFARKTGELRRDADADAFWTDLYGPLSEGRPGLTGAMLGRAEAQVMRLAGLYAVLDQSPWIRVIHLDAAMAVWRYCEQSVKIIFGDAVGDDVADEIQRLLQGHPEGVTRNDIRNHFGRHQPSSRIERALGILKATHRAHCLMAATGGRPSERWLAGKPPAP
jgi:hypothetical protein